MAVRRRLGVWVQRVHPGGDLRAAARAPLLAKVAREAAEVVPPPTAVRVALRLDPAAAGGEQGRRGRRDERAEAGAERGRAVEVHTWVAHLGAAEQRRCPLPWSARSRTPTTLAAPSALATALQAELDALTAANPDFAITLGWKSSTEEFALSSGVVKGSLFPDGRADRPADPHDKFLFGSGTKPLTAAAVLRLADAGALSLDDRSRTTPTRS